MTERMNLNMDDLAYVTGGEGAVDTLRNKAEEIGKEVLDTAGEVDLEIKTKYVEVRQFFKALFD